MARNVGKIAKKLGATTKGQVLDTGGGSFAMARLAKFVEGRRVSTMQAVVQLWRKSVSRSRVDE